MEKLKLTNGYWAGLFESASWRLKNTDTRLKDELFYLKKLITKYERELEKN